MAAGAEGPQRAAGPTGPLHVVLVNNSDEQAGTQGGAQVLQHRCHAQVSTHWTIRPSLPALQSRVCMVIMHAMRDLKYARYHAHNA